MNIKDSHYYRLFRYIMIIVLLLTSISGIIIISIISRLYKNAELNDLRNIGRLYAECISDNCNGDFTEYSDNLRQKIMNNHDVEIYTYEYYSKPVNSNNDNIRKLDESLMLKIENKLPEEVLELSSSSISQNAPYMIFGTKIHPDSRNPLYVVVYGGTDSIDSFTIKLMLIYILIETVTMAMAYFLIKRKIIKYITFEKDFTRIIENYSKGNFSEKIFTDLSPNLIHISERVNALASNVEKSEEISSTFIANVSHELRTPITTIGGFVDGILDGTIKKNHQQEYLILVSQEIHRLRILITSMLNMSKFESGTMSPNFVETNLTDLVIKVVLMFEKRIEDKQLEVEELDSSRLTAIADPDLMQQVIYNLVENAVKFVNKGGTLSFSFDKKDDICIIGIRNTGEGLKDSEIQQVFNRFYKTDSSRGKDKTGLGLGLSISRKIVHLHNGHIVVKSVYGEYTEFQIQIPENPRLVNKDKKEQ
ncbi:MAG: HAMP domain-containing histidine kinase [Ruminococcus sp.]|nr:HAMP domain-containing histidine kinase [Ruminococcus sp.]